MKITTALLLLGLSGSALAAPGFDRPGTAFNPEVLAPGSIAWEQGLPDITRDESDDITTTLKEFDSRLRVGLIKQLEVQIYGDPYAQLQETDQDTLSGAGNTGVAFKYQAPLNSEHYQLGFLASMDFNTGKAAFKNYGSDGEPAKASTFGVTGGWNLSDTQSLALYADVTRTDKDDVYTVSPSWSFALNDAWGAYVEYKVAFGDVDANDNMAGGGVTWMLTDKLQLDLSSDFGLTSKSTDLESSFGISYLLH